MTKCWWKFKKIFKKHQNSPKFYFGPTDITETLPTIWIPNFLPKNSFFRMDFDQIEVVLRLFLWYSLHKVTKKWPNFDENSKNFKKFQKYQNYPNIHFEPANIIGSLQIVQTLDFSWLFQSKWYTWCANVCHSAEKAHIPPSKISQWKNLEYPPSKNEKSVLEGGYSQWIGLILGGKQTTDRSPLALRTQPPFFWATYLYLTFFLRESSLPPILSKNGG